MMKFKEIVILLAAIVFLPFILAQPPATWKLDYSLYRLIYSFTLDNNATDVYVNVVIPTNIIDQYLSYWQSKGINVSNFPEFLVPRVYYYDETTGKEIHIQNKITCLSMYNRYCYNFTVYFQSLPAGTHYLVVYMPAFFWEDFEDNTLLMTISQVGQCFPDGWCVLYASGNRYAKIIPRGQEPTPQRMIEVYSRIYQTPACHHIVLYRAINLTIKPPTLLLFYVDTYGTYYPTDSWLGVKFLLKNGDEITLRYRFGGTRNYIPSGIKVCNTVPLGVRGFKKRDVLQDLWNYCHIPAENVSKLLGIYLIAAVCEDGSLKMYIDNLQIVPGGFYET